MVCKTAFHCGIILRSTPSNPVNRQINHFLLLRTRLNQTVAKSCSCYSLCKSGCCVKTGQMGKWGVDDCTVNLQICGTASFVPGIKYIYALQCLRRVILECLRKWLAQFYPVWIKGSQWVAEAAVRFQRGKSALFPLSLATALYFPHLRSPGYMERDQSFAIVHYVYLSRLDVAEVTVLAVQHRK